MRHTTAEKTVCVSVIYIELHTGMSEKHGHVYVCVSLIDTDLIYLVITVQIYVNKI